MEFSQLAAHEVYPDNVPGAGIITGIGRIFGRECVVVVNDATVKGGSYYPLSVCINYVGRRVIVAHTVRSVGEEAPPSAGDRARAWFTVCISW